MESNNNSPSPSASTSFPPQMEEFKLEVIETVDEEKFSDQCEFIPRESLMTRLVSKYPSAKAIYVSFFIVLSYHLWIRLLQYYLDDNIRTLHAGIVVKFMQGFGNALLLWALVVVVTIFIVSPIITLLGNKQIPLAIWSSLVIFSLCLVTPIGVLFFGIKHLSASALIIEMFRLKMKVIAFSVATSRKYRDYEEKMNRSKEDPNHFLPSPPETSSVSNFLYFLFAPTLVYRDVYPKSESRSLLRIIRYSYELVLIFMCFIPVGFWMTHSADLIGLQPLPITFLLSLIVPCMVIGLVIQLTIFYALLHCIQNIFAEILMFGDREFYTAWWEEPDPKLMYRKWNLIISNFCFSYIYLPLKSWSPSFAASLVLFLSAVLHETVIAFGCGFFLPVFFFFGSLFIIYIGLQLAVPNIMGWLMKRPYILYVYNWLALGLFWTCLLLFNLIEYWSRQNCPAKQEVWYDIFIPRTISCITIPGWYPWNS